MTALQPAGVRAGEREKGREGNGTGREKTREREDCWAREKMR